MLDILTSQKLESAPTVEQILNFINKEVTIAHDKGKRLSDLELSILSIKNSLDNVLHITRNHPMHPLNRVDDAVLYTIDEAVELLKLDRQKVINMIKKNTIPGVKDRKVYLAYKWAVDDFIFSRNGSASLDTKVTPSGLTATPTTRSQRSVNFTIDRYLK